MKTKLTLAKLIAARNLLSANEDKKLLRRKGKLDRLIVDVINKTQAANSVN